MAENRTMKEKPALCIQGMARKFVRESIIEDAATRLIAQIMTEVADAHIAPRDAEIASLRAQLDEAKARVKTLEMAITQLPEMPAILNERAARRKAIEECAAIAEQDRDFCDYDTASEIAKSIRALLSESKT